MTTVLDDREAARDSENAELRRRLAACEAELAEARARETATAEVLQVINASPGDLAPVFDAMLERAMHLCGAEFGEFFTTDSEQLRAVALRGVPTAFAEFRRRNPTPPIPGSITARILAGEPVIHVADVRDDDLYRQGDPQRRALVDLGGARTFLSVTLLKDRVSLGAINIYRQEVRPFSDKQVALLQNFAAQAVIAMENARLLTETREALEQQTATAEVLQVINSSPGDLAPVFDAMLEKALRLCDAAFGTLFTRDGDVGRLVASRNVPEAFSEYLTRNPMKLRTILGPNFRDGPVIHIEDLAAGGPYRDGIPLAVAAVDLGGIRGLLVVPLMKDDTLIGLFAIYRHDVRPSTDKQIALLENFAAQAVIAMENARLLTETREALEQQTATAEVLQVINSSRGDLAPVFDAMIEKAMRLCETAFGAMFVYDGGFFHITAVHGPQALVQFCKERGPTRAEPGTMLIRNLDGELIVRRADVASDQIDRAGPWIRRVFVDLGGARSAVSVALRKGERLLGVMQVYRQEVRPFTDKQIALLQNFAAQAVIAMENARLLGELRARTEEIAAMNRELEARVAAQLDELERVGRLKRFLAPQLAEMIVAQGAEKILESHRRDIAVAFCDLRGFTAFAETAEPEEVLDLLREYHDALGPIVTRSEGTLDKFSGDGLMVFFNDPLPCADAPERAVAMALDMRAAVALLQARWRRRGRRIGFGVGIAQGYATLGQIGFAERVDYTAIGTVCNLAARLCAEAQDGQILLSGRIAAAVEDSMRLEEIGDLALKGLSQAVAVYNVVGD
jgi:class 3 adenylate cyclase